MLRDHLKVGDRLCSYNGQSLYHASISKELSDCLKTNNILKALKMSVGVNEFHYLQKNFSQPGKMTKKLLTYAG